MKPTTKFDYHLFLLKVEEIRDIFAALGKELMKDFKPVIAAINKLNKAVEKEEERREKKEDKDERGKSRFIG